jgi:hypothetical protein
LNSSLADDAVLACVAVAALLASTWTYAQAAPQGSPAYGLSVAERVAASADPAQAYHALSASDLAAFNSVEIPVSTVLVSQSITPLSMSPAVAAVPMSSAVTAAFSGCWALSGTFSGVAAAGNTLYTYWQATRVCVSGGSVTGVVVCNDDGETSTPLWQFKGVTTATYNAGFEGRGLVKAHFQLGTYGIIVQDVYACGQLRLNANGSNYAMSYSCNRN